MRTRLLRPFSVNPWAINESVRLACASPLPEYSPYTLPEKVLPPSLGMMFAMPPPKACSAVPPPVVILISDA